MRTTSLICCLALLAGCTTDEAIVVAAQSDDCSAFAGYAAPLQGTVNTDWFITNHVDTNPAEMVFSDYRGGSLTYDQHNGIDLALLDMAQMSQGVPVLASRCGIVTAIHDIEPDDQSAGIDRPWNFVQVTHSDGSQTIYGHLKQHSVPIRIGHVVETGDQIGLVGNSGYSSGPHLHLEIRNEFGQIVDIFAEDLGFDNGYPDAPVLLDSGVTVDTDPSLVDPNFFLETPAKQQTVLASEIGVAWVKILGLKLTDRVVIELVSENGTAWVIGQLDANQDVNASYWFWTMANLKAGDYVIQFQINGLPGASHRLTVVQN